MDNFKLTFLASLICLVPIFGIAQTGPGGVGTNVSNPFWLDAHTMGGANGSQISSWTDYSGNINDAVQATPANQPTFTTGAINGRDALSFTGNHNLLAGAESNMDNVQFFQYYLIGTINDNSSLSIPFNIDYGSASADNVFCGMFTQSGNFRAYGHRISSLISADYASSAGLNCYKGEYDIANDYIEAERNFSQDAININPPVRNTSAHEEFWIGGGQGSYFAQATIGEIFVLTVDPNTAQQNIIENYISAKYGIAATTDMYTFQGTYGLGVVGIGREDASNLHTDSQGNGYVRINSPDDLGDGEYLFVGHDDVAVTSFNLNTNVPTALPGSSRFVRQWRAEKTGNVGNVTLVFDLDPTTNFSADPNNYRLLVHSAADMSGTIDHILSGAYNAGDETITFTNVDLNTGDFITLAGDTPVDIHSAQTGPWSATTTWDCGCVPTAFNDVYIDPTHNVTVDVNAFTNYFSIDDPTATLTMSSAVTLTIASDFDNIGTLTATNGTISMAGASAQYIDAGGGVMSFFNLNINNSGGSNVDLFQSEYHLTGELTLDQGTLTVENIAGGTLIVESNGATTNGRIGQLATGTDIIGLVRVERNLPGGTVGWRNLCSPVVGTDFNDWDATLEISGPGFPDGCAYDSTCFKSIKFWQQSLVGEISSLDSNAWNKQGFEVFVGDNLTSFAGTTLTVEGTINDPGDVVKSMGTGGWWTIGNPYACPITFSTVQKTSQVGNYYYVYDPVTAGYQWYDGSTNTSSVPEITSSGLLASGQGFWVFLSSAGSLTYDQQDKSTSNATFIRGQEEIDNSIYFVLNENGTTYEQTIAFQENQYAVDGLDSIMDMRQLNTPNEICSKIGILSENEVLTKNFINSEIKDKSYDLVNDFKRDGYYTIVAKNIAGFNNYNRVFLYDNVENEYVNMKDQESYIFYADAGIIERFTIIFANELDVDVNETTTASITELDNGIEIVQMGNAVSINSDEYIGNVVIKMFNLLGQEEVYFSNTSLVQGGNLMSIPREIKGVQILSIYVNGEVITKKLVF
jgi:hypothetical protein